MTPRIWDGVQLQAEFLMAIDSQGMHVSFVTAIHVPLCLELRRVSDIIFHPTPPYANHPPHHARTDTQMLHELFLLLSGNPSPLLTANGLLKSFPFVSPSERYQPPEDYSTASNSTSPPELY